MFLAIFSVSPTKQGFKWLSIVEIYSNESAEESHILNFSSKAAVFLGIGLQQNEESWSFT